MLPGHHAVGGEMEEINSRYSYPIVKQHPFISAAGKTKCVLHPYFVFQFSKTKDFQGFALKKAKRNRFLYTGASEIPGVASPHSARSGRTREGEALAARVAEVAR